MTSDVRASWVSVGRALHIIEEQYGVRCDVRISYRWSQTLAKPLMAVSLYASVGDSESHHERILAESHAWPARGYKTVPELLLALADKLDNACAWYVESAAMQLASLSEEN